MTISAEFLLTLALFLVALTLAPDLLTQSDCGHTTGTVVNPSGAPIAGVRVEATQTATIFSPQVESTPTGNYVIRELPAGGHTLMVATSRYKSIPPPTVGSKWKSRPRRRL